jgi:type IV pilus assembly protein PilA
MFDILYARKRFGKESGFTLIELLVVILIIGILAGIAIPIFLNQKKTAVEASMKSDIKNAATAMEQEAIRNGGNYPSSVPIYDKQSASNRVTLDTLKSSQTSYCLNVLNSDYPDLKFSYSSMNGGLLKGDCTTATVDGTSISLALAGKKALMITAQGFNNLGTSTLNGAGITNIDTIAGGTLTIEKARQYDIILAVGGVWAISYSDSQVLKQAYAEGAKIITDGNDSTSYAMPLISTTVARQSPAGQNVKVGLNPTYTTGLTPSFPYTFVASTFDSVDSWQCTKTAAAGVVIIADSVDPQATSEKCLTMLGMTNGTGRWIHFTQFPYDYSNPDTNPSVAAVKWLMQ